MTAAPETWTIRRILVWTTGYFEKRGIDSPRLTAEILLAHVLNVGRVRLYVDLDRPLEKQELATYRGLIERRVAGEPTQYLTGVKEFYNRPFAVDARVLVPRPETELLVERVLRELPKDAPANVLDLCTGSGCIAVTIAAERKTAQVTATDVSNDALAVARANAEKHAVQDRVTFLQGDLFAPVASDAGFDLIVSNPPYIAAAEIDGLAIEVRKEPRGALDGGPDGLVLIRRIVTDAKQHLKPGALLAMEIGETQGPAVLALLQAAGYAEAAIEKDLERRERFAIGRMPAAS